MAENIPILAILTLAVLGNNQSVTIAAAFLLIVKFTGLQSWYPVLEQNALHIGLTILTIAILVPVVNGRITLKSLQTAFSTSTGILALAAGVFAAWAAGKGIVFTRCSPDIISSIVLGTVLGVSFFNGVAIGPLIAGGIVWVILELSGMF